MVDIIAVSLANLHFVSIDLETFQHLLEIFIILALSRQTNNRIIE
jgi:hypothetical protein